MKNHQGLDKVSTLVRGAAIALALSAYACAPKENIPSSTLANNSQSETKTSYIVGGVAADSKFQSENGIVGLLILSENELGQKSQSVCTGSLIDRRVVLTAAHCVVTPGLKAVAVLFHTSLDTASEDRVRFAVNLDVHSHYISVMKGEASQESLANRSDLAILILNENAPEDVRTVRLASEDTTLQSGQKLQLAGFGNTNAVIRRIAKGKNGKPQVGLDGRPLVQELGSVGTGTLRSVEGITIMRTLSEGKEILLDQTKLKGACHGDSGGPAFLKLANGQLVQVGVTSRGTEMLGNCNQASIYGSTISHLPWIQETTSALMQQTLAAEKQAEEEAAASSAIAAADL